ncbi:hypothetical protein Btru_031653 [Bulinus truncatus]|nr:hypothetical protein Btru_031653 [Bulinus truncatus]
MLREPLTTDVKTRPTYAGCTVYKHDLSPSYTLTSQADANFEMIFAFVFKKKVITPSRNIIVCADTRRDMEEWINALKMAANKEYYENISPGGQALVTSDSVTSGRVAAISPGVHCLHRKEVKSLDTPEEKTLGASAIP